jgi:hypothetical protein
MARESIFSSSTKRRTARSALLHSWFFDGVINTHLSKRIFFCLSFTEVKELISPCPNILLFNIRLGVVPKIDLFYLELV